MLLSQATTRVSSPMPRAWQTAANRSGGMVSTQPVSGVALVVVIQEKGAGDMAAQVARFGVQVNNYQVRVVAVGLQPGRIGQVFSVSEFVFNSHRNPLNQGVLVWVVFDGAAKGVRTAIRGACRPALRNYLKLGFGLKGRTQRRVRLSWGKLGWWR